jgi:hypothetical protein
VVVLQSAAVCPSCKKHLRFVPSAEAVATVTPLRVEGSVRHPDAMGEAWEYSVLVTITNDRGEEVGRQVVGVGALQPGEERTFTFSVEVFAPGGAGVAGAAGTSDRGDAAVTPRSNDLSPSSRRIR